MMIYATADIDPCIPINNLPTAHKHYKTYTNLCSTIKSTLETICNLSTAYDHQYFNRPARYSCKAHSRLGSSISTMSRDCCCNADRLKQGRYHTCGTLDNLSSNLINPFRPYCNGIINSAAYPYQAERGSFNRCNKALEDS